MHQHDSVCWLLHRVRRQPLDPLSLPPCLAKVLKHRKIQHCADTDAACALPCSLNTKMWLLGFALRGYKVSGKYCVPFPFK